MTGDSSPALKIVLAGAVSMIVTGAVAWFSFGSAVGTEHHCQDCHDGLLRLDTLHAPLDENGVPLWYVPRSLGDSLESIVTDQRLMVDAQIRLVDTLSRLETKLNQH